MRHRYLAATVLAMALPFGPASAQAVNPGDLPLNGKMSDADMGRAAMVGLAKCVVKLHPKAVDAYLAKFPYSPEWRKETAHLATADCLDNGELRFNPNLLRGSLFVAKYERDFRAAAPQISDTPIAYLPGDAGPDDERRRSVYYGMITFADCVVRRDPTDARDVVMSLVGSRREANAFGALGPSLSQCLPAGSTIKLSKEQLSGAIAEALYRISVPAPGAKAGSN